MTKRNLLLRYYDMHWWYTTSQNNLQVTAFVSHVISGVVPPLVDEMNGNIRKGATFSRQK